MEGDNIEKHIDILLFYHNCLNSLITKDNPLTPNAILTMALFISLPSDWTLVVNNLMQCNNISSAKVIRALQNKSTRQKSSHLHTKDFASASKATMTTSDKKRCTFCK
ncbi:hypothetical protein CROQUDRAFT_53176 [Cronartium quercuum f. sp. fusiforme G11]|uniref:Uncharacterized protein n=1 Tax=Cronartium quercuum f. sp. fusiforme G11 TaxID=708437 RepID=A0A9P6T6E5_9BASI|nr:hypothetical protein CROQUDRAFT_53176 [Cronartium quercuum f. sp. fusiforme G11]